MLELARRFGEPPVLMASLAETEGISRKYLHTLLTLLKSAGLVHSIRGAGGGFTLARPPSEIHLDEVLHAVEGPLCLVDCVEDKSVCDKSNRCTARRVWQELSGAIENALARVTLADMIASGEKAASKDRGSAKRVLKRKPQKNSKSGRSVSRYRQSKVEHSNEK
jgi:Rrf2 family protein